jgi:hypothetical protein
MPSPESRPGGGTPEHEPFSYQRIARFAGEKPAGRAYTQAQHSIFTAEGCDLSVFRLLLGRDWHVAVLGDLPPQELSQQLDRILSRGVPATLPAEVMQALAERRAEATKLGPWVERHLIPPPEDATS